MFDQGFYCDVDFAPIANGEPPVVVITGRVEGYQEFDHEEKQHEVRSARAKNEDIEEILEAGPDTSLAPPTVIEDKQHG